MHGQSKELASSSVSFEISGPERSEELKAKKLMLQRWYSGQERSQVLKS